MRTFLLFQLAIILVLASSCAQAVEDQTEFPSMKTPVPSSPHLLAFDVTSTRTPTPSVDYGGELWIIQNLDDEYILIIDILSGDRDELAKPRECNAFIHHTPYLFCIGSDKSIFLFHTLTGEVTNTPIENPLWLTISPDGKYLLYEPRSTTLPLEINSYGIDSEEVDQLFTLHQFYNDRGWISVPFLSAEGQHFGLVRVSPYTGSQLFELIKGMSDQLISTDTNHVTWDINWSPFDQRIIYGVSDYLSDVALPPNRVYLNDFITGENIELSEAPNNDFYLSFNEQPIWSSNRQNIALVSENSICVIEISSRNQECMETPRLNRWLRFLSWAPSGGSIALLSGEKMNSGELLIYDISSKLFFEILDHIKIISVDWR